MSLKNAPNKNQEEIKEIKEVDLINNLYIDNMLDARLMAYIKYKQSINSTSGYSSTSNTSATSKTPEQLYNITIQDLRRVEAYLNKNTSDLLTSSNNPYFPSTTFKRDEKLEKNNKILESRRKHIQDTFCRDKTNTRFSPREDP